jgi:hypothetical protein
LVPGRREKGFPLAKPVRAKPFSGPTPEHRDTVEKSIKLVPTALPPWEEGFRENLPLLVWQIFVPSPGEADFPRRERIPPDGFFPGEPLSWTQEEEKNRGVSHRHRSKGSTKGRER